MDLTRHCELCDNQKFDLKSGITCGLTDRKPVFSRACPKIKLTENFKDKLKAVNIEYQNLKLKETMTYINFTIYLTIGIVVIVSGYALGKFAFESGVISKEAIIIMGAGIAPLGIAFGTLNKYKQRMEVAKIRKDNIDEVLKEYQIEYVINIVFGEKIHGVQEVSAELTIKGIQ